MTLVSNYKELMLT